MTEEMIKQAKTRAEQAGLLVKATDAERESPVGQVVHIPPNMVPPRSIPLQVSKTFEVSFVCTPGIDPARAWKALCAAAVTTGNGNTPEAALQDLKQQLQTKGWTVEQQGELTPQKEWRS